MEEPRVADITYSIAPDIKNPFPVYVRDGAFSRDRLVGAAAVSLINGAFAVRLFLDPHNPEVFDLVNEPKRCKVDIHLVMVDGLLSGSVHLSSK